MAKEFKLPELGENIESAEVLSVLVSEGDTIKKDQGIIEIETDKATVEVPSEVEGKITELLVKEGDKVKVGQVLIKVENGETSEEKTEQEEKTEEKKEEKEKAKEETKKEKKEKEEKIETKKKEGQIIEVKLPDLGENIDSADILSVLVSEGDSIEKEQGIIEIETDKATVEVPSEVEGKVTKVLVKKGEKAKVGQTLIKVKSTETVEEPEQEAKEEKEKTEEKREAEQKEEKAEKKKEEAEGKRKMQPGEDDHQPPITIGAAPAAPSVRRIAREIGVDINEVPGTGPGGRITMDDVKAYSKKLHEGKTAEAMFAGVKAEKLPDFSKFGEVDTKDMSNIRSKTADHLSYAWATIPHVTQHDKADITELEESRKKLSKEIEKDGAKLTVTSILVKILVEALKKFPQFNSSINMEKKKVIYKKYFNIGIAVDTDHGLIVPVVKNADQKNLKDISIEITEIAKKARARKIGLDDLQGGCITITNLGGIGGTYFTPVVNSPEVAILGVSRGSYGEPVYKDSEFIPRLMLPLSLSYDHRIIDGADADRFLRWICEALENPIRMFL